MSSSPQPATSDDDEADEPDEAADEVAERLDELDEADVEEPGGDVRDADDQPDPFDGVEDADDDIDVDLADVDVGEEVDADGPFDGVDDVGGSSPTTGTSGGGQYGADVEDATEAVDGMMEGGGALADTINEGAGRLATVGLPEEFAHNGEMRSKEDLEEEFVEVFETFKLGKFAEDTAEKYMNVEGDIDPIWGFTASLLVCSVLVIQMRPDGDELFQKARRSVGGMGGTPE